MNKPPCKDCLDRKIGCHAECERYIQYDESRKKEREQKNVRRILNDIALEQTRQPRDNAMKRMTRRMYGDNNDNPR